MNAGASPSLTVEDRFLLKIAVKNGLLSEEQVRGFAARVSQQPSARAEERLIELGLLTKRQLDRLREAMAASQVVRLDTLYAAVLLETGLASQQVVDAAFRKQREERYRARLGQILVQQHAITLEQHHKLTSKVIRRLKREGQEAYASAVEAHPAPSPPQPPEVSQPVGVPLPPQTLRPPPPRPPEPPKTLPPVPAPPSSLGLSPDERTAATQSERNPVASAPPRIPLDETQEAHSLFGRSSAYRRRLDQLSEEDAADSFLVSAIRIGLDSDESLEFRRSDETFAAEDLVESKRLLDSGAISGRVLGRVNVDTGSGSEEFDPDAYLQRKRRRTLALRAALVAVVLLSVVAGGGALALRLTNRGRLTQAEQTLARAPAVVDLQERAKLYAQALDALEELNGFGVPSARRKQALVDARWGALETRVRQAIEAGKPQEAKRLLSDSAPPASLEARSRELAREVERALCLAEGRAAEADGALGRAVLAYQRALPLGDPGGAARDRLHAIRQELDREMLQAYQAALASLSEPDEQTFFQAAKRINDLFNEDPGSKERLSELRYQRALKLGRGHLAKGRLGLAAKSFSAALDERAGDAEARRLLDQVQRKQEGRSEEERGASLEERGDLEKAIAAYRQALSRATPAVRQRLQASIERCQRKLRQRDERLERNRRRLACVALLRESRIAEAREGLEALAREGQDPRTQRLLEFARKLDGMVYVPPGKFLMGSRSPASKPHERPQRQVEVPGYFIDRTEVTNAAYARYVRAAKLQTPEHWDYAKKLPGGKVETTFSPKIAQHPMVKVSWREARAYARWRGGDLPSEAQWEKAARGTDGRLYPWGARVPARAHIGIRLDPLKQHQTSPVGVHKDDESPFGVFDMAGNVNEWTLDMIQLYPGAPKDAKVRSGRRAVRGGAYRWRYEDARCAARDSMQESYRSQFVGFRVVVEVPAEIDALR